jgi:glycosyltransferase involved in cell wall biosynthesis
MKSLPRISVITPSFNQSCIFEQTILSVTGQRYPDLEYIVIDGGSTDGSVDAIRKFQSSTANWVSEKDRGQAHAINKGLQRATGDIIGFVNSDDYYLDGGGNLTSICCMVAVKLLIGMVCTSSHKMLRLKGKADLSGWFPLKKRG